MSSQEQDFLEVMEQGAAAGCSSADAEELARGVDEEERDGSAEVGDQEGDDFTKSAARDGVSGVSPSKADG